MRAADVYRALLWCYPAEFRNEYGKEMVGAFADQLEGRSSPPGGSLPPVSGAARWSTSSPPPSGSMVT